MTKDEKKLEEAFKRAEKLGVFDEAKKIREEFRKNLREKQRKKSK